MKYILYGIDFILILGIILIGFVLKPYELVIKTDLNEKVLNSNSFSKVLLREDNYKDKIINNNINDIKVNSNIENNTVSIVTENVKKDVTVSNTSYTNNNVNDNKTIVNNNQNVLETQYGSLAAYGPDCVGCSGYLSSGFNANESYVYNDSVYGNVRIVAGDKTYPMGTIVRITNSKLGSINAIVLDRGGGVGFGKRHLFDLLFASEHDASNFGSNSNTVFEILRYGY